MSFQMCCSCIALVTTLHRTHIRSLQQHIHVIMGCFSIQVHNSCITTQHNPTLPQTVQHSQLSHSKYVHNFDQQYRNNESFLTMSMQVLQSIVQECEMTVISWSQNHHDELPVMSNMIYDPACNVSNVGSLILTLTVRLLQLYILSLVVQRLTYSASLNSVWLTISY